MKKWFLTRSLMVFLCIPTMLLAQFPSERTLRDLVDDTEIRGDEETMVVSEKVLKIYPTLEPVFEEALENLERAMKKVDRYIDKQPNADYEWGDFLKSFEDIQRLRESFQDELRETIAERAVKLEAYVSENRASYAKNAGQMGIRDIRIIIAALNEIKEKVREQQGSLQPEDVEGLNWPEALPEDIEGPLKNALRLALSSGDSSRAWARWEKQMQRIDALMKANLENLKKFVGTQKQWVDEKERFVALELEILMDAEFDLTSNAILQDTTASQFRMMKAVYENWKSVK